MMDRLSGKPMKPDQFIKHYKFVDEDSARLARRYTIYN